MFRSLLVRLGFRFADNALEALFVERFILVHLSIAKIFMIMAAPMFGIFFLWDRAIDPANWTKVLVFRELVVVPGMLLGALALFIPGLQRRLEAIVVANLTFTLIAQPLICAQLHNGFQYGAAGMVLLLYGGVAMFPLRLGYVIAPSLIGFAGYLAIEAWTDGRPEILLVNNMMIGTGVVLSILTTVGRELAARREFLTGQALEEARGRVDDLLHSMLPREIVARIQAGETTIADIHGEVSIIFADLVGFTALSRQLTASQLVVMLNSVFSRFDAAASALGIEKIKTIGDAYMAVGGLAEGATADDHVDRMARFAMAMRDITAEVAEELDLPIKLRVGLHVGSVVAGVIGIKKPAFDCWGEAVNMASRLETACVPGTILLSGAAGNRLRDRYMVESRGELVLRGIGHTRVFVLGEPLEAAAIAA